MHRSSALRDTQHIWWDFFAFSFFFWRTFLFLYHFHIFIACISSICCSALLIYTTQQIFHMVNDEIIMKVWQNKSRTDYFPFLHSSFACVISKINIWYFLCVWKHVIQHAISVLSECFLLFLINWETIAQRIAGSS